MIAETKPELELPEDIDKPEGYDEWKDEFKEWWMMVRLGHEGMMVDKILKQNNEVMKVAKQSREGTLGQPDDSQEGKEVSGVNIGNKYETHYHNEQEFKEAAPETKVPAAIPEAVKNATEGLSKGKAIAAVTATGLGSSLLTALLLGGLEESNQPLTNKDTDTYKEYTLQPGEVIDIPGLE
jgi:hypothetical protein